MQVDTDDHLVEVGEKLDLDIKDNSFRMASGPGVPIAIIQGGKMVI
jgi:hypothetical protein